jgi:hypothetical protein
LSAKLFIILFLYNRQNISLVNKYFTKREMFFNIHTPIRRFVKKARPVTYMLNALSSSNVGERRAF